MSKKILCLLLASILILSLSACSPSETLINSNKDNSITLVKYSYNYEPTTDTNNTNVPDNYILMSDNIYAVLDENNEISSYQKLVYDEELGKEVFKECDANGNLTGNDSSASTTLNSITINTTSAEVKVNKTVSLSVATDPVDFVITDAKWESSDENVATVLDGVVTGKSAGSCEITVKIGEFTQKCVITVLPAEETDTKPEKIEPSSVKLSKNSVSVYVGNSTSISATVSPSDATDKTVTWHSSNTNIATVYNGTITGKSAGTATITVKTINGKEASCTVTVTQKPEEKPQTVNTNGISLSAGSKTLDVGDDFTLTATVSPSNATNKSVTWTSSNNSVASVSNGKVTAIGAGTATITAKASGGQTATCTVTVNKKVEGFTWQQITQSNCPLNISNEFDKYILSGNAKNIAFAKDGYTYVMIKAAGSGKVSISSVTESNGKITIKYSNSGSSNYVFIKFNRENTNITFTN